MKLNKEIVRLSLDDIHTIILDEATTMTRMFVRNKVSRFMWDKVDTEIKISIERMIEYEKY